MSRRLGMIALLVVATACLPTAELSQDGVFGTYVVNGVDPVGTDYSGRLSISPGADANDVVMEWIVTGSILQGRGTIEGNTINVEWESVTDPRGSTSSGTATYEILDDGHLFGTLRVDGFDDVGTETVYPEP